MLNLAPMERNLADSVESTGVPISIVDDGNGRLAPGSAVGRLVLPHEGGAPSHANAGPHELSHHGGLLFLTTPWGAAPGLLALGGQQGTGQGMGIVTDGVQAEAGCRWRLWPTVMDVEKVRRNTLCSEGE